MPASLRVPRRVATLLTASLACVADFVLLWMWRRGTISACERAIWLHRWCRRGIPWLGLRVKREGPLPKPGLVVLNHLSYLDILALSAVTPCVFVAKKEVRGWPLFGLMARMAGTIFIDRKRLRDLPRVISEINGALASGMTVVIFPEGTTTDGSLVLPFRSALLEAAVRTQRPVTPACISYDGNGKATEPDLCWWGDMTFMPHLTRVFRTPEIAVTLGFSEEPQVITNRKHAANAARDAVIALRSVQRSRIVPEPSTVERPIQAAFAESVN
jgi:1-acyl-sn-glycerol-3-phosphate acyltransferase